MLLFQEHPVVVGKPLSISLAKSRNQNPQGCLRGFSGSSTFPGSKTFYPPPLLALCYYDGESCYEYQEVHELVARGRTLFSQVSAPRVPAAGLFWAKALLESLGRDRTLHLLLHQPLIEACLRPAAWGMHHQGKLPGY